MHGESIHNIFDMSYPVYKVNSSCEEETLNTKFANGLKEFPNRHQNFNYVCI